jgi:hypothetical protein
MGQCVITNDGIDREEVREYLEERIRSFCGGYVYGCCPKEYRQSDEWKEMELSKKLSKALDYSNIDDFIEHLIGEID